MKKTALCVLVLAMMGIFAATTYAGLLGTAASYNGWEGTTSFWSDENPNLHGYVEWAVFGPGAFPFTPDEAVPYQPTVGELTYVYQVFNTGSDYISFHIVPLDNVADNIGAFSDSPTVTGVAPVSMQLFAPGGSAVWEFSGIPQDNSSEGLCFSSQNTPMDSFGIEIDGGAVAISAPIPVPSTNPIPEPATLWSLMAALGMLAVRQFRRR